jgi:hypothetical protein
MAEVLTVTGGAASLAQILAYAAKTAEIITEFCHAMDDAPAEIQRTRDKIVLLKVFLDDFQLFVNHFDDQVLLPLYLRQILRNAIHSVFEAIIEIQRTCSVANGVDMKTKMRRLKWALIERHQMKKLLQRLANAENNLTFSLSLLTWQVILEFWVLEQIALTVSQS